MTLWRVVVMDHKKEDFINSCKKEIRCYAKEYDEDEIINLPKEMKERDQIKNSIEEKKVNIFLIRRNIYSTFVTPVIAKSTKHSFISSS
jgi:hypothetical protein